MPPVAPAHYVKAKRRMRQGLHPAAVRAREASLNRNPADLARPNPPSQVQRKQPAPGGKVAEVPSFSGLAGMARRETSFDRLRRRARK